MPKINSLEVVHQDTNKDSYQNLHDILVALNKSLALEKEVVDGEARAAIENLLELYVNDKEAFLRSLQTLTTEFKNSTAQLQEEILLRASEIEATAKKTTTLTAHTETQFASVKEYSEAVASEVARKVSTYSQDDPPTDNLIYGDLWTDTNDNNRMYRWNGLVWIEITKIPTFRQTTAPAAATIGDLWMDTDDNNKMYRWNGSSWVATDDTRIATTYARWGVQVDAGGRIAGIQLNSDNTGTSEFTVLADNFRVFKSGITSSPTFTVESVGGTNQVVVNGNLVVTKSIVSGSVLVPSSNRLSNTTSTVCGVTFTISGLNTGETIPVFIQVGIAANANCNFAIFANSTQLSQEGYVAGQNAYMAATAMLGNGTHTAAISTDLTGSLSRTLTCHVIGSKR
jgi:hypothetical protein